jgi:GNAT superfamily N-acetyltransferase
MSGSRSSTPAWSYRSEVRPRDREAVRAILSSSGFFYPEEIAVAEELVEERLQRGLASGYHFEFAEAGGPPAGYTCYGPIACTRESYDLYWIGVHQEHRRAGLGRRLLARAEERIGALGGRRIYVETSSRAQYEPTRAFYLACGYRIEARLEGFYAPGDGKVIFLKVL